MPAAARALLFALCALAAPAYLQASELCSMATNVMATKFTITVAPAEYKENTNYTVTVSGHSGTDTFTAVQFQALDRSKNTNSGNWTKESGTDFCPDYNLLYNTSNHIFTAHWKSSSTAAGPVEIRAYITEADGLKFIAFNLTQALSSATEPTKGTETTKHSATDAPHDTHTTHSTAKPGGQSEPTIKPTHTTTGGSDSGTYSSCILIAVVQSVYLLFISGRQ